MSAFIGANAFAQTSEPIREEKASEWIKVGAVEKESTTVVKKKPALKKTEQKQKTVQPAEEDVFDQTNKQVKRFKKTKS